MVIGKGLGTAAPPAAGLHMRYVARLLVGGCRRDGDEKPQQKERGDGRGFHPRVLKAQPRAPISG